MFLHHASSIGNLILLCRRILPVFIYLWAVTAAHSSQNVWTRISIGGPEIKALAVDPTNSNILYAGTSRGFYKSTDGGKTLFMPYESSIGAPDVYSVAIDPKNPNTIYAGALSTSADIDDCIFKTTDAGAHWQWAGTGLPSHAWVRSLAVDPQDNRYIYAGLDSGGVYRSNDGGKNWSATGRTVSVVLSIVVDSVDPEIVYAGSWSNGVYRSTDRGVNWTNVNNRLNIRALALDPHNHQTIYAGTDGDGVYKSSDSGGTWTRISSGMQYDPDIDVHAVAVDPTDSRIIYAGTDQGGVFKSLDAGANWIPVNTGIGDLRVMALALGVHDQHRIYAGTMAGGMVYRTADRGANWKGYNFWNQPISVEARSVKVLVFDPFNPSVLYASAGNGFDLEAGIYKSIDGGMSWIFTSPKGLPKYSVTSLAVDPRSPTTVYAGFSKDRGVYKTTDGGTTWNPTGAGLDLTSVVTSLAINPRNSDVIYAGISFADGVYKSANGGASWTLVPSGFPTQMEATVQDLAINPQNPDVVYAAVRQSGIDAGGVYRSTDAGASWRNTNLPSGGANHTIIDPQSPDIIYAGKYKSINGGSSWTSVGNEVTAVDFRNGALYSGALKSTDGGANWIKIVNDDFPPEVIAVSPYDSTIYGGYNSLYAMRPSSSGYSIILSPGTGGATNVSTPGSSSTTYAGYATLTVSSGSAPYGTAVFSFKQNGVTVTEAGVPASPPTTSARVFIDFRSDVAAVPGRSSGGTIDINTGIAVVNRGTDVANVTYTLRRSDGYTLSLGNGTIAAGNYFAKFIDQLKDVAPDFNLPSDFQKNVQFASLQIESNQPLSVLALRMTVNQKNQALLATIPVADLLQSPGTSYLYFPQFADGGGFTSSLILLNTSDRDEKGILEILGDDGGPLVVNPVDGTEASSFAYRIPSGGSFRFQTNGSSANIKTGWVLLTPDPGNTAPVGSGVFSYNPDDALVSESGIPAAVSSTHARVYVDLSENHNTGLAIANPSASNADITIEAFQKDGVTIAGSSKGPLQLVGRGHQAQFADQLISGLPTGFTGVLDISSSTPFAALTLRSLINEEGSFLMTTFPIADASRPVPLPIIFPQIADGGGYVTEFILISPEAASRAILRFWDAKGRQVGGQ
jgi:photosystem II stability/assembly factor-like uncharacterized protein